MKPNLEKALAAKRESKRIDFKENFDPSTKEGWCEIIKDIVSMANSGGGVILFGLDNTGRPLGVDVMAILKLDHAVITDKINSYTENHFSEFEIVELTKESHQVAAIKIGPSNVPLFFTKPGTYPVSDKKQQTAFAKGTVYFRHGAKSEPGNSDDLRQVIEQRLKEIRKEWIDGVRKVVQAPTGSNVTILAPKGSQAVSTEITGVRIVDDPTAPGYKFIDPNNTHPYRQVDVVAEINKRMENNAKVNSYDILCVRKIYKIDTQGKFYYKPAFGSPQYSNGFVDWLQEEYRKDQNFFRIAREEFSRRKKGKRSQEK